MRYTLWYHAQIIKKDIPLLGKENCKRIKKAIEERLSIQPAIFGKPLRESLKGHRSLRVGDYRIIFRIEKEEVKIFSIEHRSDAYIHLQKRIKE